MAPERTPGARAVPLLVTCALFMETLDASIITTALPAITASLGEDPLALSLAVTSYLLSLALFIPVSGWVADRFGGRAVFRAAILVFTVGSVACGLADSLEALVAARIVQGMGGAMMVPVGRLILLCTVPKAGLLRAMAFMTLPALVGPVIGPPLGGMMATYASWRWIFFVNVPIGVIGFVLVSWLIRERYGAEARPMDWTGFTLVGTGLAGAMLGLESLGRGILPGALTAALLGGGIIELGLYVAHAQRHAHPVIDLTLMRIPTFRAAMLGGLCFRVSIGAIPFLLPMMLQLGLVLTPFASGLITFAGAAGALTMKMLAAPILRRFGFRRVPLVNTVVSGALLMGYTLFEPTTAHGLIIVVLLIGGFFRSLQFTALNTLCKADTPPEQMSRATGLVGVAQQVTQSLGVGLAAIALHLTLAQGDRSVLAADDFDPAYIGIGALSFKSPHYF